MAITKDKAGFYEEGGYDQKVSQFEITCTCMWTTMEMSRFKENPKERKDCKHIKALREKLDDAS